MHPTYIFRRIITLVKTNVEHDIYITLLNSSAFKLNDSTNHPDLLSEICKFGKLPAQGKELKKNSFWTGPRYKKECAL